jgi:hypothetical protein
MKSLEDRYRRLLAAYPQAHRDKYEEEMLAVLIDDARPGQRRPGLAESLNLLLSGVRARIGDEVFSLSDRRWRAAAGVVGILLPVALALKSVHPIAILLGYRLHLPGADFGRTSSKTIIMVAAWTLAATTALLGLRRVAAGLAWASVLTQTGFLAAAYLDDPVDVLHGVRLVAVGLTAAICLSVAEPLDRKFLLNRPGRAFGLAVLLTLGWFTVYPALGRTVDIGDGLQTVEPRVWAPYTLASYSYLGLHDVFALTFAVAAALTSAVGIWRLDPAIRRRFLAILAPTAVLVWFINTFFAGFAYSSPRFTPPVLLVTGQWLGLAGVPLLTFVIAALIVHGRERTIELLAFGRAARRTSA